MRTLLLSAVLWVGCIGVAHATIPRAYRVVAAEYGVPADILYAIALQESRATLGRALKQPWPWTLNIAGRGMRYGSRRAVASALAQLVATGETRVDVGLMQVHWRWHHSKLGTPWTATDPYRNLRVGASVLVDCYRQERDWPAAIGCYHSPTAWRALAYNASVQRLRVSP